MCMALVLDGSPNDISDDDCRFMEFDIDSRVDSFGVDALPVNNVQFDSFSPLLKNFLSLNSLEIHRMTYECNRIYSIPKEVFLGNS